MPHFRLDAFADLTLARLYEILTWRSKIFVVEQQSLYLDLDDRDQEASHLLGLEQDRLVAYARWYAAGSAVHLGRVLVVPEHRGSGLARALMKRAISELKQREIEIEAQTYLERFYASLGFVREGPDYLLDGLPHLPMRRPASAT